MTDDLRIEWMRLDDLVPAKRNSKVHDLNELDTAIDELGFITELKVDERTGELHSGNGRRDDLRRKRDRGETVPEGIRVDTDGEWLAPVVRGWSSRDALHATAAAVAVNNVGKAAGFDSAILLDELAELAADAPDLLRATAHTSDDLDRLMASAGGDVTVLTMGDLDDDSSPFPPSTSSGKEEQWGSGDDPDEGSTREDDGPGPLDVDPAWRTLQPWRAIYHDGTPDGADRVARWLRGHAKDVHVTPDLSVAFDHTDGTEYLVPGKWCTRDGQDGWFDVWTREEFADRFVPANEPARRAQRDAAPVKPAKATVPSAAELLRHGSGVHTNG